MSSTRQFFDKALEEHQQTILRMGSLVEQAIYKAVHSLATQNVEEAKEVISGDNSIDQMELEIEDKCLKLIATQLNVSAGQSTPEIVAKIRYKYPKLPIIATGGPTEESIAQTILAGANAITYTPPPMADMMKALMKQYREDSYNLLALN
jgi:phosphate uptake regulator